jgi:polar amino acid transport system substrate-binding protein
MRTNAFPTWLAALAVLISTSLGLIAAEPVTAMEPPLRVGVAPVSPPMIFKEGPRFVGVEADLAHALGQELGRDVKFVECAWEDLIDALDGDRIDIIMSSMSITRARQFRVAFSAPYLRVGQMALVRADEKYRYALLGAFVDRTIGVRKATVGDLLVQQEFPRAKRKYFKSDDEAALALSKSKIDMFIDDSSMIWYLAGVYEAKGLAVAPLLLSEEVLAWATRRSDTQLIESANAFLKKIQANGELDRILHRWIPKLQ